MPKVMAFEVIVPVLSSQANDFGAERLQDGLKAKGWSGSVQPMHEARKLYVLVTKRGPGEVPFTFKTLRGGNEVSRTGVPFEPEPAQAHILSITSSVGTKLVGIKDWVVKIIDVSKDFTPGAVASTSAQYFDKKKEAYDACIAAGGSALTCGGATAGLPNWVVPVGIGLAVLFVLGQIVSVKRAFLGGTDVGRRGGY